MRERARDIGAKFEFSSSVGVGTQIDLVLESRRAYAQREVDGPWKGRSSRWLAVIRPLLPGSHAEAEEDSSHQSQKGDGHESTEVLGIGDHKQEDSNVLIQ